MSPLYYTGPNNPLVKYTKSADSWRLSALWLCRLCGITEMEMPHLVRQKINYRFKVIPNFLFAAIFCSRGSCDLLPSALDDAVG